MSAFKKLGLSDEVLKALLDLGFEKPTEIQQQAIPHLISGDRDLKGIANTGTGKTAAFGLPLLELIDPFEESTQGLILAPTRELCRQIAGQLELFGKYLHKVNTLAVYGGASISTQIKALKKTQHIIIATPGRLIDLINRKKVNLNSLQYLILDEADEMLNMGFKDELDEILKYTPSDKKTWLFSATMPAEIKRIVKTYMHQPIEVSVDPGQQVNTNILHLYTTVRSKDKLEALTRFLDIEGDLRGVVFCKTRKDTQELAEALQQKNYRADALHGDMSQSQRDRVMGNFRSGNIQLLVATDVAARGIDVDDLSHVFHFTLPDDMSYYTHRSGRTARAGKSGTSIAFINGKDSHKIKRLENQLGISFEKKLVPESSDVADQRLRGWAMEILETRTKGKLDPGLLDHICMMFGNLSKEELIAKILMHEIGQLNLDTSGDLNDHTPPASRSSRGNGRRSDRRKYFKKRDRHFSGHHKGKRKNKKSKHFSH